MTEIKPSAELLIPMFTMGTEKQTFEMSTTGAYFEKTIVQPYSLWVYKHLEECGRICYKSEHKITEDSYRKFLQGIISRGHEAVLEHVDLTVKIICDRGVSHEIVRHRIASYCQESTRYCNYANGRFNNECAFVVPANFKDSPAYDAWKEAMEIAEAKYKELLELGCTPQMARSVLPNSLKTELVMTANIREWRHFLKLRTSEAAHPDMRVVALAIADCLKKTFPILFEDINFETR